MIDGNLKNDSVLSRQELAASRAVAPYICGAVVADGPLFPGETWRGTMEVDEHICPNAQYSVVSMLSEYSPRLDFVSGGDGGQP